MGFITAAIGFLGSNIKWVAIIALVTMLSLGAWRYTKLVENYAIAQQTIAQLNQNIKDKENALAFEREKFALSEQIIEDMTKENKKLTADLENITSDLPEDAKDKAPDSILETLDRLGQF